MAKASTTKKASKTTKQAEAEPTGRKLSAVEDPKVIKQIVQMRDVQGKKWGEISAETGLTQGRAQMAYFNANRGEAEATPKAVLAARDKERLSWGKIMARFAISVGKAQELYREAGGDPGQALHGNGSAVVSDSGRAKKAAKAAPVAKAGRKKGKFVLTPDMDDDAVIKAVAGRKIEWSKLSDDGTLTAKVGEKGITIKDSKKSGRTLNFNDGSKARSVALNRIVKVG